MMEKEKRSPRILMGLAILLTIMNLSITYITSANQVFEKKGEFAGFITGPVVIALIIVGIFQIWKRFRNLNSRLKIYCWTALVLLIGSYGQMLNIN